MKGAFYSVVVPVYNSERSLEELHTRLVAVFDSLGLAFELILVDDSSKDGAYRVMRALRARDKRVKIAQLSRNYGQMGALLCGLGLAKGDFVLTMDDDLQHPPEEIPKLIEALDADDELDVVIAEYEHKQHSLVRSIGSALSHWTASAVMRRKVKVKLTSFRLMRAAVAQQMHATTNYKPQPGYLILDITSRVANVTVRHDERAYGHSGYSLGKLVSIYLNNLYTQSVMPLIVVRNLGLFSFAVSIIGALYYLIQYFTGGTWVEGWTTLVLMLFMFSGLILLSIGIVGEYLIRILNEAKKNPNYLVRRQDTGDAPAPAKGIETTAAHTPETANEKNTEC